MNLAEMLSERMKSPGAMAAFKDMTSNPQARAQVGPAAIGSDPAAGGPMQGMDTIGDPDGAGPSDPSIAGNAGGGMPGDSGLGMLSAAHASAHGKLKERYGKALAHGKAKHGKHTKK